MACCIPPYIPVCFSNELRCDCWLDFSRPYCMWKLNIWVYPVLDPRSCFWIYRHVAKNFMNYYAGLYNRRAEKLQPACLCVKMSLSHTQTLTHTNTHTESPLRYEIIAFTMNNRSVLLWKLFDNVKLKGVKFMHMYDLINIYTHHCDKWSFWYGPS